MKNSQCLSCIPAGIRNHKQVNNTQLDFEFKASNDKEYTVDSIWDNAVYAKESIEQLSGLYYLVLWKSYPEEGNTWESVLAI